MVGVFLSVVFIVLALCLTLGNFVQMENDIPIFLTIDAMVLIIQAIAVLDVRTVEIMGRKVKG